MRISLSGSGHDDHDHDHGGQAAQAQKRSNDDSKHSERFACVARAFFSLVHRRFLYNLVVVVVDQKETDGRTDLDYQDRARILQHLNTIIRHSQ